MPTFADTTITIRRATHRKIKKLAREQGRKVYGVVDHLLDVYERQQRQAPNEPNVTPSDEMKPLAGGNESADSPLAGDEKVSFSDSPSGGASAPSGAPSSMQPADGTAASTGANGVAPLSPSRPSVSVSGNGSHAVERSPSSRERDKR